MKCLTLSLVLACILAEVCQSVPVLKRKKRDGFTAQDPENFNFDPRAYVEDALQSGRKKRDGFTGRNPEDLDADPKGFVTDFITNSGRKKRELSHRREKRRGPGPKPGDFDPQGFVHDFLESSGRKKRELSHRREKRRGHGPKPGDLEFDPKGFVHDFLESAGRKKRELRHLFEDKDFYPKLKDALDRAQDPIHLGDRKKRGAPGPKPDFDPEEYVRDFLGNLSGRK